MKKILEARIKNLQETVVNLELLIKPGRVEGDAKKDIEEAIEKLMDATFSLSIKLSEEK